MPTNTILFTQFIIFAATILSECNGLRCWHCENENNNWDCMLNGKLQQCQPSQLECQNEIRSIANDRYFKITKRCKQDIGCDNNRKQNELLTNSYRCEKRDTVDVCWCCCTGDNCNGHEVYCKKINPRCKSIIAPLNGIVRCQRNDTSLGTNCVYRCLPGYDMVGTSRTTCVRTRFTATWSSSPPTCEPVICNSIPNPPKHGSVFCSKGNSVYSICEFTCSRDLVLIGDRTTVCSHLGTWSNSVPECVKVICRFPESEDEILKMECSNGNNLGSYCRFTCAADFEVYGFDEITCGEPIKNIYGRWTKEFPVCVRRSCGEPGEFAAMNKTCTDGNNIGSVCTYFCDEGNYMTSNDDPSNVIYSGVAIITCNLESGWSGIPPVCRPIACPRLNRTFSNGGRTCTQGDKFLSECSYTCVQGYRLSAPNSITCEQSTITKKGEWSNAEPQCVTVYQCDSINFESENKECTDRNNEGSICTYSCEEGEIMTSSEDAGVVESGIALLTCVRGIGWSNKPPVCRPIMCPPLLQSFKNGNRICTRDVMYGSECIYTCNPTYRLTDSRSVTCVKSSIPGQGMWSVKEPQCVGGSEFGASTCLNYNSVANGEVRCEPMSSTNGTHWLEGSACRLFCAGSFVTPIGEFSKIQCGGGIWIGKLCCDVCLSTRRLDIIVLMDSSYVDYELWEVSKTFNADFALYLAENYKLELNFIVVPYATSVDNRSMVKASNINFDNYQILDDLVDSIPFAGRGDSNTGKALQFVNDVLIGNLEVGSVPLIVILSNKQPVDSKLALTESKRIRDKRGHIRIVPFTDFYTAYPGKNKAAFEAITGGEENSIVDSESVENFYEVATRGIKTYDTYCDIRTPTC
ncbi:P-selectin-like isoform X1 [Styela clava]